MSIQSKKFKSAEWKRAKRERSAENAAYRAGLHQQKWREGHPKNRDVIQRQIDEISKRGARKR